MWCWRRMERISWTDRVRDEVLLQRVKEERNIVRTIKRRNANWVLPLCTSCLPNQVIEGKIEGRMEVTVRQGRRRNHLLDDLQRNERVVEIERGRTGSQSLQNSLWKRLWTCLKTDYGMNEWMNDCIYNG